MLQANYAPEARRLYFYRLGLRTLERQQCSRFDSLHSTGLAVDDSALVVQLHRGLVRQVEPLVGQRCSRLVGQRSACLVSQRRAGLIGQRRTGLGG